MDRCKHTSAQVELKENTAQLKHMKVEQEPRSFEHLALTNLSGCESL